METDIRRDFGRRLRQLRVQAGVSQEELAERAGIHRTYLSGIERGQRNPSLTNLARIAEALRVNLPTLLDFGEEHGPR